MADLMECSNEWATRPVDERFVSLTDLHAKVLGVREHSKSLAVASRAIKAAPVNGGLAVVGPDGSAVHPTHWAFGQLAQRAGAPAGYLRTLPSEMAVDCINWGLVNREVEDIGVLLYKNGGAPRINAITGPSYGRIWNSQISGALVKQFGDGVTGDWRVPGIRGKKLEEVTKGNTTLYAGDRDMFVFLADEERRIEIPNRRDGKPGSMARGFFVRNSEVGAGVLEVTGFLFDFVCQNRIVWGAEEIKQVRIRHTSGAPHRWVEEVRPAVDAFARGSAKSLTEGIIQAQRSRIGTPEAVEKFLAGRFTRSQVSKIAQAHKQDEHRPIETLWDAAVGATAYARSIEWQDERVEVEREAGEILKLAKA